MANESYPYELYENGNLENKILLQIAEPPKGNTLYFGGGSTISVYAYRGLAPDNKTFRFEKLHDVEKPAGPSITWDAAMQKVPASMHAYADSIGFIVETVQQYKAWERTYSAWLIRKDDSGRTASPEEAALWSSLRSRMEAA